MVITLFACLSFFLLGSFIGQSNSTYDSQRAQLKTEFDSFRGIASDTAKPSGKKQTGHKLKSQAKKQTGQLKSKGAKR